MRRLTGILIIALAIVCFGANAYAQISSAAVLFLRIAAGARAAGMGEAFVAVADDATATHWNPAGLGQYPLSDKWDETIIPDSLRPLTAISLFKGSGPETDYQKYDIWALSSKGLVRYADREWIDYDILETRTDQTAEYILRRYTGLSAELEEEKLTALMNIVGDANNDFPREKIDTLENMVTAFLDKSYADSTMIKNAFDSLRALYNACRIDSDRLEKAGELIGRAVRDSLIREIEADKILFSLEKSVWKYIQREIKIPFSINFKGALNDIASDNKFLWVATDDGLFRYNGRWQRFGMDYGFPTDKINSVTLYKKLAYLGTDTGLVLYDAGAVTYLGPDHGLPHLPVSAVAIENGDNAWAVLGDDLYRFDGKAWYNYVMAPQSPTVTEETIYDFFKIMDTPDEREKFIEKLRNFNPEWSGMPVEAAISDSMAVEDTTAVGMDSLAPVDDMTALPDTMAVGMDSLASVEEAAGDSTLASTIEKLKAEAGQADKEKDMDKLKVPFTAGFKFKVYDMEVDNYGSLWIGTEYGLMKFTGKQWKRYGYRRYTVENATTVFDLALSKVRGDSTRAERLAGNIAKVNDLKSDELEAGQSVDIYANPAGSKIYDIHLSGGKLLFGTANGMVYFDGIWGFYDAHGLGHSRVYSINEEAGNKWFLSGDKISVNADATGELTLMHVNWLPELADDIYYEYLGFVRHIEGWGTIGANITYLTYGSIIRTSETGTVEGEFDAYDVAFTFSYGVPLTTSLSGGISAKIIYSHLSELGAGEERGSGTSTGLALDLGLLYRIDPRLTLGMALTNLGPDISYIDVAQADPLPRNLAIGLAWKIVKSQYNEILFTVEANKSLADRDKTILEDFRDVLASPEDELKGFFYNPFTFGGLSNTFKGVIINGGIEYKYSSFFAMRGGYIHDEEGDIHTPTLGFGIYYNMFKFDFAYIPSSDDVPLANTMRYSLSVRW